jgi:amino acid transporter
MPSLRQWFPFQEVHTRIPMSPLGINGLDYWLGLIMEYAIGNITVAISWSDYFTGLLDSGGIHLPQWVQMDYSLHWIQRCNCLMQGGKQYENLSEGLKLSYTAWTTSPAIGSFHFVADLPALFIIILITALVYRGMKESRNASNVMVVVKLCIILLVIAVGVFYVDMDNWTPLRQR